MIRVLVADDQNVVRSGLRMILAAQEDIEVIGEASNGQEAVQQALALEPDVILMDIRMPDLDGIEATKRITRRPDHPKVVVLTTYGLDENVYAALKAGASGFLVKTDSPEELIRAVRAVESGDSLLGPATTQRLIEHFLAAAPPDPDPPPELERLTTREVEVLRLVATGRSNSEIARDLFVSEGTVKTHVARILSKLGCRDRVQVVVLAYEAGVVRRGEDPIDP
jgi:DNA-binding NarL/FixJ family response regulator